MQVKRKRIRWEDLTWSAQQYAEKLLRPNQTGPLSGEFRPSCNLHWLLTWDTEMRYVCKGPVQEWRYYRWGG